VETSSGTLRRDGVDMPVPTDAVSLRSRCQRGCLLRVSGFSQPQTHVSIRQFAEHAVSVEYCDHRLGDNFAHLRLQRPEDCFVLLQDINLTSRMLGFLRPQVRILEPAEEDEYWRGVDERRGALDRAANANSCGSSAGEGFTGAFNKAARRKYTEPPRPMLDNPHGLVRGGPVRTTTVQRWRGHGAVVPPRVAQAGGTGALGSSSSASPMPPGARLACFIDVVGGKRRQVQAGFGRGRRLRRDRRDIAKACRKGLASTAPPDASAVQRLPAVAINAGTADVGDATLPSRKAPRRDAGGSSEAPPAVPVPDTNAAAAPSSHDEGATGLPPRQRVHKRRRDGGENTPAMFPPPSPMNVPCAKPKQIPRGMIGTPSWKVPRTPGGSACRFDPLMPPPSPIAVRSRQWPIEAVLPTGEARVPHASPTVAPDSSAMPPPPGPSGTQSGADGGCGAGSDAASANNDISLQDSMLDVDADDILGLMDM